MLLHQKERTAVTFWRKLKILFPPWPALNLLIWGELDGRNQRLRGVIIRVTAVTLRAHLLVMS